jgi:cardiolipin synthase
LTARTRRPDILSVPNIMSIFRILLIPVFIYAFFKPWEYALTAAAVLVVSGITDVLDGFIARKHDMATELGKVLDPVADKLTVASVCACLVIKGILPVWLLILIIAREVLMIAGSAKLFKWRNEVAPSMWYGKLSTVMFYVIMTYIVALRPGQTTVYILIFIALAFMLFSFFKYIVVFRANVRNQRSSQ